MFCIDSILVCYINEIVDTEEESNSIPSGFPNPGYNAGTLTRSQSECVSFVQKRSFTGDFF